MDEYEILERLGEGTFGEVHKALKKETGKIYALKSVRIRSISDGIPNSSLREIRALRELSHPNIVKLYDVFSHGISLVLCFECMQTDLQEIIRSSINPLPHAVVKSFMLMIIQGIAYCHEQNIIHRVRF
jgi:cell cycle related kinase